MKAVLLDYMFLFDPANTWQHLYQFEQDLAKFFKSHGFESEIIKNVEGQTSKRLLYIRKKEEIVKEAPKPVGRPQTIKGRIRGLTERKVKAPERKFKEKSKRVDRGFRRISRKAATGR